MRVVCRSQDSQEWFSCRVGKVTASCIYDATKFVDKGSKKRGDKRRESSAVRAAYISELAWGLISRVPIEHFVSRAMDLGKQYEKMARAEYAFRFCPDEPIERTGFVLHPTLDFFGASPDGYTKAGGVELKVPQFRMHKTLLETDVVPEAWAFQCYGNMLCLEKESWDFASFLPCDEQFGAEAVAMPDEFRMYRKRFYRDEELFKRMEEGATATMEEAIRLVASLRERYSGSPKSNVLKMQLKASLSAEEAMQDAADFIDSYEVTP